MDGYLVRPEGEMSLALCPQGLRPLCADLAKWSGPNLSIRVNEVPCATQQCCSTAVWGEDAVERGSCIPLSFLLAACVCRLLPLLSSDLLVSGAQLGVN